MSINYPTSLDNFSNPTSTDLMENASPTLDHDVQHSNANDAIEALEAKVGADGSAVTTSHDYKLGEVTGSDKAVGKTATQTLTNKTLGSGTKTSLGSDATGDMYYRDASGNLTRLALGTTNYTLSSNGTIPVWSSSSTVTADEKAALAGTSGTPNASNKYVTNNDTSSTPSASKVVRYSASSTLQATSATAVNYQAFTSSGTWTKPTGLTGNELVLVQLWGAGGGGGGVANGATGGAGGGGGGTYTQAYFRASDIGSTVTVTLGAGGAGGVGAVDGTAGGNSTFGSLLTAYGGGGGGFYNGIFGAGGGGGGNTSAGATATSATFGAGGGIGGGATAGSSSAFGGAGGGAGGGSPTAGGSSTYGGGGGGGGASLAGGTSYFAGGGGGGGTSAGVVGSGGSSVVYGGAGGAGGVDANGNAGTAPAGGGGGAGNNGGADKTGGTGARGECRVFVTYLSN